MATWRETHWLSARLAQSRGVKDKELWLPAFAISLHPSSALWRLTRWPGSSSKTNTEGSHANSVLWSIAPAVSAAVPAVAARAAGCAPSAEDAKFSTVIRSLCRGINPEKAGGPFEDNDEDGVPRSEGKAKVDIVSIENMISNAVKAARRRAVKQCVLKGAARRRVAKEVKVMCPGLPWPRRRSLPLRLRAAQQAWAAQLLALLRLCERN